MKGLVFALKLVLFVVSVILLLGAGICSIVFVGEALTNQSILTLNLIGWAITISAGVCAYFLYRSLAKKPSGSSLG